MFLQTGRDAYLQHTCSALSIACFALAVTMFSTVAGAQSGVDTMGTGGRHAIQGRLIFATGQRANVRLKVKVESNSNIAGDLSVLTDGNGGFSFRGLRAGTYTVIIEGGEEYETVRETVRIESDVPLAPRGVVIPQATRPYTLQVYLQPKRQAGFEQRPGIINAALAGISKAAVDQYHKAIEAARNDETNRAIEHLKAAIEIHPDFALALSELGMQYMKLKPPQADKAVDALGAALKLRPDDYALLLSYGIALFNKGDFDEAEKQLRRAVEKNEASPSAHYYLGVTMIKRRNIDAAEKELLRSIELGGAQMGLAHYYLGGLYWARRDYKRAVVELETYLKLTPNLPEAERERLRATIKDLRSKS